MRRCLRRLRSSELERMRTRNKLKEFRDKIQDMEGQEKSLHEELERYKRQASFADSLRTSLTKKDGHMRVLRRQLDQANEEVKTLRNKLTETTNEYERRLKYVDALRESSW